jgi:hypothetical protein
MDATIPSSIIAQDGVVSVQPQACSFTLTAEA